MNGVIARRRHDTIRPRTRRGTPTVIMTGTIAATVLAVVLAVVVAVLFSLQNDAFHAIGTTDGPETEASTGLYHSLSDMDAEVANLLLDGNSASLASYVTANTAEYTSDETTADSDLRRAAVVAANNPAEQQVLQTVLDDMATYEGLAAKAIYADQTPGSPEGRPSAASLKYFGLATNLMSDQLLPAVSTLTTDDTNALDSTYSASRSGAYTGVAEVLVAGLVLAGALVWLQFFLRKRTNRMLNPGLAAATAITLILTLTSAGLLAREAGHLYTAKVEAFDSIIALNQARAVSYDANADESRYLVDPADATFFQNRFLSESQSIANVGNAGIFQYDAAFAAEISAYQRDNSDVAFGGYLGDEFRNITFPGERAAATRTLLAYQLYERDDRVLRADAKTSLTEAIAFDIGTATGQSDWAFNTYTTDLQSVITINQNAFTAAVNAGSSATDGWTLVIPAIGAILVIGLAFAGVRPRLREYR